MPKVSYSWNRNRNQVLTADCYSRTTFRCMALRVLCVPKRETMVPKCEGLHRAGLAGVVWSDEDNGTAQFEVKMLEPLEVSDFDVRQHLEPSRTTAWPCVPSTTSSWDIPLLLRSLGAEIERDSQHAPVEFVGRSVPPGTVRRRSRCQPTSHRCRTNPSIRRWARPQDPFDRAGPGVSDCLDRPHMYSWKWLKVLARHSLLGRIMLARNTQFSVSASTRSLVQFHCSGMGSVS